MWPEATRKLLGYGLDPNQANEQGQTALFFASTPEMVQVLLEAGADPHHRDENGHDAPTYWGKHQRDPRALLQAWGENSSPQKPNGEMVVSAVTSNSWATVELAIQASGWDPLTAVDPEVSPKRLLQAASHDLLETARGTQAIPCRPLLKLLSLPTFKNAWTDEERAYAAAALWVIGALSKEGRYAFTPTTKEQCREALKELMDHGNVAHLMAHALPDLLTSIQDPYQSVLAWEASMLSLPIASSLPYAEQGWECAGVLITQPPARIGSIEKERRLLSVMENAFKAGVLEQASAQTLLGLLRVTSHENYRNRDVDPAWRKAWSQLPEKGEFPSGEPWVEKLVSSDKDQSAPWKAWILDQDLEKGNDRPKPRF